jgi:hypothetical protein
VSLPLFTNLTLLAAELEKRSKNKQLRMSLKQAWRAQSCLGDLCQALDSCRILRDIVGRPGDQDTPELLTTQRALLSLAINLYARATSTNGQKGERGSIQLDRSKLSVAEWQDHQTLLNVRNQALAHVYSSQQLGNYQWHREMFFAVQLSNGSWKAASATNQIGFHMDTFERLERMIPVANKFVMEKFQKRMATVSAQINNNGVEQSEMLNHQFDPIATFGSKEAVARLIAGASQTTDAFWVNE